MDPQDELMEWSDPPEAKNRGPRPWSGGPAGFVQLLKERPGQWAQYRPNHPHSSGTSEYLKARYGVEATTRVRPDKKFDIWARWPFRDTDTEQDS